MCPVLALHLTSGKGLGIFAQCGSHVVSNTQSYSMHACTLPELDSSNCDHVITLKTLLRETGVHIRSDGAHHLGAAKES